MIVVKGRAIQLWFPLIWKQWVSLLNNQAHFELGYKVVLRIHFAASQSATSLISRIPKPPLALGVQQSSHLTLSYLWGGDLRFSFDVFP